MGLFSSSPILAHFRRPEKANQADQHSPTLAGLLSRGPAPGPSHPRACSKALRKRPFFAHPNPHMQAWYSYHLHEPTQQYVIFYKQLPRPFAACLSLLSTLAAHPLNPVFPLFTNAWLSMPRAPWCTSYHVPSFSQFCTIPAGQHPMLLQILFHVIASRPGPFMSATPTSNRPTFSHFT